MNPSASLLSTTSNNNTNLHTSSTPYDSAFVEKLLHFDPNEVTPDFLEATNKALLEQEKQRKKWKKQQHEYEKNRRKENVDETTQQEGEENLQQFEKEEDQNDSTSSSSSSSCSSSSSSSSFLSSDDDDTEEEARKQNQNKVNAGDNSVADHENKKHGDDDYETDDVATAFAQSFLAPGGAVEHFVRDVRDTARTLQSLRSTIRRFSRRMEGVTNDVSLLQRKARKTEISLINNHNVQQFTSAATELLIPSLDMVRILMNQFSPSNLETNFTILQNNDATAMKNATSSDLPELGRQYMHSVRSLEKLILARQSHMINVLQQRTNSGDNNNNENENATSSSTVATPTVSGKTSEVGDDDSNTIAGGENKMRKSDNASSHQKHEFVSILFRDIPNIDLPSRRVVEALARQTCLQVRNFLTPRVAAVIGKPRTNIAIQQRSALLPYRTLVSFLRTCATSPDLLFLANAHQYDHYHGGSDGGGSSGGHASQQQVSAAEAASAFYDELRATYTHFASLVYTTNFKTYVSECVNLQQKTSIVDLVLQQQQQQQSVSSSSQQHQQQSSGGGWLDTATSWFSSNNNNNTTSSASSQHHHHHHQQQIILSPEASSSLPSFPSLADMSSTLLANEFSKKVVKTSLIMNLHKLTSSTPVLPLVQKQQKKFHSPLETFRSINMLLCDVVTSEFLFTFEFFDGDTAIYDRVFKPVVDFLIQFVMQHFIPTSVPVFNSKKSSSSSAMIMKEKSSISPTDVVSLGILSLSAVTFRNLMRLRGLHCLDEYFSHVLTMFLPCTKRALEAQYEVIRNELLLLNNNNNNNNQPNHQIGLEILARAARVSPQQLKVIMSPSSSSSSSLRLSLLSKIHPICDRFAHLSFSLRTIFIRMSIQYLMNEEQEAQEENNNQNVRNTNTNNNIFLTSKLHGLTSSLGGNKNNNNTNSSHYQDSDEFDDSDQIIAAMCGTFKAMCLDFIEWMKKFSQEAICSGQSIYDVKQQSQQNGDEFNQHQQQQLLPIPSVFILNNLGSMFSAWNDLGFPLLREDNNTSQNKNKKRSSSSSSCSENDDDDDDDLDDFQQFQKREEKMKNKKKNLQTEKEEEDFCILRQMITDLDKDFHQEYENAIDEFSYEILKFFMGNVISAIQDAEMKVLEIVESHQRREEGENDDEDEDDMEKEKEKEVLLTITSLPQELEAACRWFIDNAESVLSQVSQYCKSNLIEFSSSSSPSANNNIVNGTENSENKNNMNNNNKQHQPLTDAMKRTFTQILLWNTRMHTVLGKMFSLINLFSQHQQKQQQEQKNSQVPAAAAVVSASAPTSSPTTSVMVGGTGKNQQRFRALTVSNVQLTQWMQRQV